MPNRRSRHADLGTYRHTVGGGEVELFRPPLPRPCRGEYSHVVVAGDRLDTLAQRYYGDPLQFWRIVDANPVAFPEQLLEPGRVLTIPRGV